MTEPMGAADVVGGGAEVLERDVPCRKCGYNLRGLATTGRCPECGTPVGLSVSGDLLQYSDPAWLEGLRRGVNLIILGVVLMIVAAIVGAVARRAGAGMVGKALMLGAHGVVLAGWWLLSRPDPSGIGEDRYGTARQVIRVGLIAGAVASLGELVAEETGGIRHVAGMAVNFLGQIVSLVGLFAQLQYLKKLASRIPDDRLAGRADFLMYAIGISYGVIIVFGVAVTLVVGVGGRGAAGAMVPIGCVGAIAGLALLVFMIMYLLMVERFGKRFREQAEIARQTWAAGAR